MPLVGPILHFRGQQMDRWRLSALVVSDALAARGRSCCKVVARSRPSG